MAVPQSFPIFFELGIVIPTQKKIGKFYGITILDIGLSQNWSVKATSSVENAVARSDGLSRKGCSVSLLPIENHGHRTHQSNSK